MPALKEVRWVEGRRHCVENGWLSIGRQLALAHNLKLEERRGGLLSLVGCLRTKFPGGDLRIRERLVKVFGHRELGDLAELAGAAAVARCGIALGVRSGATGPGLVMGAVSAGLRLGGHVVNLRCHDRKPPNPWRNFRVS
jgi:hypothetical protein